MTDTATPVHLAASLPVRQYTAGNGAPVPNLILPEGERPLITVPACRRFERVPAEAASDRPILVTCVPCRRALAQVPNSPAYAPPMLTARQAELLSMAVVQRTGVVVEFPDGLTGQATGRVWNTLTKLGLLDDPNRQLTEFGRAAMQLHVIRAGHPSGKPARR